MRSVAGARGAGGGGIAGRRVEEGRGPRGGATTRGQLQRTMTAEAGVLRSAGSLERALAACRSVAVGEDPAGWELANLATVGEALCLAALAREESRGAHTRTDFPELDDALEARLVAFA